MKYWPHFLIVALAERLCSYYLKKTESIAANSTTELLVWGLKRLFKKRTNDMKTIVNIGNGALVVTENGGDFTLTGSEVESVGGGTAAGIVSGQISGSIVLKGKVAFDLGMALLEAHSPAALVPIEQTVQTIGDAEIAAN